MTEAERQLLLLLCDAVRILTCGRSVPAEMQDRLRQLEFRLAFEQGKRDGEAAIAAAKL
jgi:hypothetical protein